MPGGTIRTDNGEILIRTTGQAYWGQEFEDMIVLTQQDGTRVALRDIAQIRDTFAEGDLLAQFNGRPGVVVNVSQVGNEDLIEIAQDVREQVANFAATEIPPDIYLDTWIDTSYELQERMSVLTPKCGWWPCSGAGHPRLVSALSRGHVGLYWHTRCFAGDTGARYRLPTSTSQP